MDHHQLKTWLSLGHPVNPFWDKEQWEMASRRPRVLSGGLASILRQSCGSNRPEPSGKAEGPRCPQLAACISWLLHTALPKAMNTCCPHQLHGPHSVCQVIRGHASGLARALRAHCRGTGSPTKVSASRPRKRAEASGRLPQVLRDHSKLLEGRA